MKRRVWTPEEDLKLIILKAKGLPTVELARRLGRSRVSIWTRLRVMKDRTIAAKAGGAL